MGTMIMMREQGDDNDEVRSIIVRMTIMMHTQSEIMSLGKNDNSGVWRTIQSGRMSGVRLL